MPVNDISPKMFLRMTRVIYFSLWSGLMTFLIMVLSINKSKFIFNTSLSDPLMISTFLLACLILPAGYMFARKAFGRIDQNDLLMNKLTKYQTGHLIRLATCEGIGLLSIVSLMLTSNLFFLIFLMVPMFIMVLYYPTPDKIGSEINLTQKEIEMFNGHNEDI
jgi:hypothetical protein